MRIRLVIASALVFASAFALGSIRRGAPLAAAVEEELMLFTEQEASELRVRGDEWDPVPRARSAPMGPLIVVRTPRVRIVDGGETIETRSPTTMKVEFEQNQAPVDMSSLEVKAKKGVFTKALTDRLTPFIEGTTLAVSSIEVPAGRFQIEITVKDLEGHETTRTYRLVVEG